MQPPKHKTTTTREQLTLHKGKSLPAYQHYSHLWLQAPHLVVGVVELPMRAQNSWFTCTVGQTTRGKMSPAQLIHSPHWLGCLLWTVILKTWPSECWCSVEAGMSTLMSLLWSPHKLRPVTFLATVMYCTLHSLPFSAILGKPLEYFLNAVTNHFMWLTSC